ncbi:hypothetical protein GGR58DRAFT_479269 [Xylaria digitata]|nr:hypothetical protein GGR58DRAFT_479269 [Xylaria digitata]
MNVFPDLSHTLYTSSDWNQSGFWFSDHAFKSANSSTGDTPEFIPDDFINSNESHSSAVSEKTEDAEEKEETERTRETAKTNQSQPPEPPAKPKRKRENRYKNAPPAVISRRRAQNRASQRAYRERKDQRIKELESRLEDVQKKFEMLTEAYHDLEYRYSALKDQRLAVESQQTQFWPHGIPWEPNSISSPMYYPPDPMANFTV